MKPIDFYPDAGQEANDAVDYYDGVHSGLGDDFRAELEVTLARIQQNPQLYTAESGSIRIWVAAIRHQSRRPGYWARRQPN